MINLTEFEKTILERAFEMVSDIYAWDDLDLDYESEIKPTIDELTKKLLGE